MTDRMNVHRNLWRNKVGAGWLLLALVMLLIPRGVDAQGLTYSKGQTMHPAFEGWERTPDGSINLLFGYLNRNWEEVIDIPVGPDNSFSPGPADRGQPTHFLPRRNRSVFRVPVPPDFGEDDELVWTLKMQGQTFMAHGSLASDYFVDHIVIMSENGSIYNGRSDAETRGNTPPVAELEGETERRVRVGEPVTLSVKASDDGIPRPAMGKPYRGQLTEDGELDLERIGRPSWGVPGKVNGLHVSWFIYRGPGEVTFEPQQIKVWEDNRSYTNSPWSHGWVHPDPPEDGRWVAQATFNEPGTYVLRGLVDDGGLSVYYDVTVEVTSLIP